MRRGDSSECRKDRDFRVRYDDKSQMGMSTGSSKSKDSDPRPPGEEDESFDRSFHRAGRRSHSRSRSPQPSSSKNNRPNAADVIEIVSD